MKNRKFNSLDELLEEIDNWINLLENKKEMILLKAGYSLKKGNMSSKPYSKENFLEKINNDNDKKKTKVFTTYSVSIYKDNYDLLAKESKKSDMSISSFLKKKYFLNFLKNKDTYDKYDEIKKYLGDRIIKGRNMDRKAIGLALDDTDNDKFTDVCREFNLSTKDMLRFFVDAFLYDVLTGGKIAKEFDYGYEDIELIAAKESSFIYGYGYNPKEQYLFIKMKTGAVYLYRNVPKEVYKGLYEAESKGKYFNVNILPHQRDLYDVVKIRGEE